MELIFPAEEDTVDELGLGRLSDAIAERLYPGTTVLMTRPRYLYLVAALYRYLEISASFGRFDVERKRLEDRTREALLRRTEEAVIGRRAKANLKRYPSSIYWRALAILGLLKKPVTQQQYLQRLSNAGQSEEDVVQTDDGISLGDQEDVPAWDDRGCGDAFRDMRAIADRKTPACRLDLTKREAADLRRRYMETDALKDSLLAMRLKKPSVRQPDWPWDCKGVSTSLEAALHHAQRVSAFSRGATLQYYGLLLEKRKDDETLKDVRQAFATWWEMAVPLLSGWKTDEALAAFPSSSMLDDAQFVNQWTEVATNAVSGDKLWANPSARALVGRRDTRRPRSRLNNKRYLEQWDVRGVAPEVKAAAISPYRLSFRHFVANRFVLDVASALKGQP
jgi:hypothetical protein